MRAKLEVAIIGAGRLGSALAHELSGAGYRIGEIVSRAGVSCSRKALALAHSLHTRAVPLDQAHLHAQLIWLCVADREIEGVARTLAAAAKWKGWKGKIVFHSSGALSSAVLDRLRRRGAQVAAVHPVMTFVHRSVPSLRGVPFAIEGDTKALSAARRIVRDLGGQVFSIDKEKKATYHAWATMICPLLVAALATAEQVARAAGLSETESRRNMFPIVRQTLNNYAKLGPAAAFSGPLVRGDASVVRQHLEALGKIPEAKAVYIALARSALRYLPVRNRSELSRILKPNR